MQTVGARIKQVFGDEIRGGRSVARDRRAPPETAQDLLALTGKDGCEFGTAAPNGWGTGKAREWLASGKPVVGLIQFLLSLPLAYHWLPNGQAMACQTKGRRSDFRSRAGHALTGQYVGASLD